MLTGGASGIGAAIALELARHGMNVAVLDIDENRADSTAARAERYGVSAAGFRVDTANPGSVTDAARVAFDRIGGIDTLRDTSCAQKLLVRERSKEQHGVMIHVSSIRGASPQQNAGVYSPAKLELKDVVGAPIYRCPHNEFLQSAVHRPS